MVYLFNRTYYTSYCYAVVIPTIIIATIASLFSKGTFILEQSDSTLNRAFQLVVRSAFVFEGSICGWLNKSRDFTLANSSCCLENQMKFELQVERLYSRQTRKTLTIKRTTVRDTSVSGQSLVPNWGHPLKPLGPAHYRIEGLKAGP